MINYFRRGIPTGLFDVNNKGIRNGDTVLYIPTKEKYTIKYDESKACFVAAKESIKHPLYTLSPNTNIKVLASPYESRACVHKHFVHIG